MLSLFALTLIAPAHAQSTGAHVAQSIHDASAHYVSEGLGFPGHPITIHNGQWQSEDPTGQWLLHSYFPEQQGHWSAVRLSNDKSMHVTALHFLELLSSQEDGCSPGTPILVQLYVDSGDTPPNTGNPVLSFSVAAPVWQGDGAYPIDVSFGWPVSVPAGENLFVTFQYDGPPGEHTCLLVTNEPETRLDSDFWSNAADQPYDWVPLDTLGYNGKTILSIDAIEH